MKKAEAIFRQLALTALVGIVFALAQPSSMKTAPGQKIRRTILLKFKAEASPSDIRKVLREVKANISSLKGVRNVFVGAQIIDRIPFTWGISMDFENEAALKAYRQDQEHRRTHNEYGHLIEQAQISDIRDE